MSEKNKQLTEAQIRAIERTVSDGYRVEVIPVKDGLKIVRQRRDEVKCG